MIDWVVDATVWGQATRGDNPVLQVACRDLLLHLHDCRHSIGIDTVGHIMRESERQLTGGIARDIYAIWGNLAKKAVNPAKRSKKLRVCLQELKVHKEDQIYFFVAEQLSNHLVGCETRWLSNRLIREFKRRNGIILCGPRTAKTRCMTRCASE